MHSRIYLAFRVFWALAAVGLLAVWLHIHALPNHEFRTLAVSFFFVQSLLLIWRPDGRFFLRRV